MTQRTALRKFCLGLQAQLNAVVGQQSRKLPSREDSRAFGAMVETMITGKWPVICRSMKATALAKPGRRTIYDCSCNHSGQFYGVDVKTKNLDSSHYSDGGVCSVGNVLRFLASDAGILLIAEISHIASSTKKGRLLHGIRVAPFHLLPRNIYRIENLGTGQIRLNQSIGESWSRIEWNRTMPEFYNLIGNLAIAHYHRVKQDADRRINAMRQFIKNGHGSLRL